MKTISKTMSTLARLREHRDSITENVTTNDNNTPSERPLQHQNVVEFHPEEIDDITPLRPDEVDDIQLAEFFRDHDLSFLFESNTKKRKWESETHRIPEGNENKENAPTPERSFKRARINDDSRCQ